MMKVMGNFVEPQLEEGKMPCQACQNVFYIIPCESKSGLVAPHEIKDVDERRFFVASQKPGRKKTKEKVIDYVASFYRMMKDECPCKLCIVKMMCDYSRTRCPIYKELLDKIDGSKVK